MLEFAEKANRRAHEMRPADLDALRRAGFDDGEILEIVHIVGFFRYYNVLAEALGVEPEPR
jgi:alkylhydroperoxidase family enzyme